MSSNEVELFFHAPGRKPVSLFGAADETLLAVLSRGGAMQVSEVFFVGECVDSIVEAPDAEHGCDTQEPVDLSLTLIELDLHRVKHVHHHPCRHVQVDVNYGGLTKHRRFSPSVTVGTVTKWARRKFKLDPESSADYVLQFCGGSDRPRPDQHLSDLERSRTCSLCFDLVKEVTPQG